MDHEGRLWWFERMNCAVRTAHVKRPTWWGGGKTCSCAWQCCQAGSTTLAAEWGSTFDTEKIGIWPTRPRPCCRKPARRAGWPGRTVGGGVAGGVPGMGRAVLRLFNFEGPTPYVREPVYP